MTKEELFETLWNEIFQELKNATKEANELTKEGKFEEADKVFYRKDGLIKTLDIMMNHYKESRDSEF